MKKFLIAAFALSVLSGCSRKDPVVEEIAGIFVKHGAAEIPAGQIRATLKQYGKDGLKMLDKNAVLVGKYQKQFFVARYSGGQLGVGAMLASRGGALEISQIAEGSAAAEAGLRPGDKLLSLDGADMRSASVAQAYMFIRRKGGVPLTAALERGGKSFEVRLEPRAFRIPQVSWSLEAGGIGYIRIAGFQTGCSEEVRSAINKLVARHAKKYVLDLRFNAGGMLYETVGTLRLFCGGGRTLFRAAARHAGYSADYKGEGPALIPPAAKLVVLVNSATVSGAEVMAVSLRSNAGAVIVGQKTAGQADVQKLFNLADGRRLRITVAEMTGPGGERIDGAGVSPDFSVDAAAAEEAIKQYWISNPGKLLAGDPYYAEAAKLLNSL